MEWIDKYLTTDELNRQVVPEECKNIDILRYIEQKEDSGKKFGLMGILIKNVENDIPKAIKYYEMAIEKGHDYAMNYLYVLLKEEETFLKKYIKEKIEHEKIIREQTEYITELECAPNGPVYEEAKKDFYEKSGIINKEYIEYDYSI